MFVTLQLLPTQTKTFSNSKPYNYIIIFVIFVFYVSIVLNKGDVKISNYIHYCSKRPLFVLILFSSLSLIVQKKIIIAVKKINSSFLFSIGSVFVFLYTMFEQKLRDRYELKMFLNNDTALIIHILNDINYSVKEKCWLID